jgi:hypothetical protein
MGGATAMINFLALCALAYHHFLAGGISWWLVGVYAIFLGFLTFRARRLKQRTADLLTVAARHAGLGRVSKTQGK